MKRLWESGITWQKIRFRASVRRKSPRRVWISQCSAFAECSEVNPYGVWLGHPVQGDIGPAMKGKTGLGCCATSMSSPQDELPQIKPTSAQMANRQFLRNDAFFSDQQRYEAGVLWVKDNINLSDNHQGALMWVRRTIVVKQWRVGQNYLPRDGPELQPGFCREVVGRAVEADTLLQLFLTLNIIAVACQNSFFVILCVLKLGWGGEKIVKQEYTGFWQRQLNILYLCSCVHNLLELTK
jgi:hypothetical protein